MLLVEPRVRFFAGGWRECWPDAIYLSPRCAYVFEIKLRHTELAYWELNEVYLPALRPLFKVPLIGVEMCCWYHREVRLPVERRVATSWRKLPFPAPQDEHLVYLWDAKWT